MLHYAMLAEQMNVEMFSIGCELVGATQSQYSSKWRELISVVRGRYHGKLIYCSNCNSIQDLNGGVTEYQQVDFSGMRSILLVLICTLLSPDLQARYRPNP